MSTRYTHTNIISADWRRLADFYTTVFDCVPVPPERDQEGEWLERATSVPDAHLTGVHLRLPGHGIDGPTLEIYSYDRVEEAARPIAANRKGLGHLAFHVDDVDDHYRQVIAHGGSPLGEITTRRIDGVGTLRFAYVLDPDGNVIEIQNWS